MNEQEVTKLLKSYEYKKRKVKNLKLKVQSMERALSEPNAGLNFSEVHANGKARDDRFAEYLDIKDKYEKDLVRTERACSRIVGIIQNVYTKNEDKTLERENIEEILYLYYINLMSILDIMIETSYSRTHVFRYLKKGRKFLVEILEDIPYKECIEIIYDEKFIKHGTQWDSIMC